MGEMMLQNIAPFSNHFTVTAKTKIALSFFYRVYMNGDSIFCKSEFS